MTDPLSLIAMGAAVGGAAGKFVEKAWDSGEKWITSYFADHRPKAIAQAQANSAEFLNELAKRVKSLEDQGTVSKEQIEVAQEHPDFSVALQKAMLTAAQTEDPQKHQLLARTLADRLGAKPEGMRAMKTQGDCGCMVLLTSHCRTRAHACLRKARSACERRGLQPQNQQVPPTRIFLIHSAKQCAHGPSTAWAHI